MSPILILLFGVAPGTAIGTDLIYASATKTVGTLVHGFHQTVNWQVVGRLAAGSAPATVLTVLAMSYFQIGAQKPGLLLAILGVMLLLTAASLLARARFLALMGPLLDGITDRSRLWSTVALGAVLGCLVTLSSLGAGAIGVPVLLLLYPRLPVATLVGSDIAHAVPLTLLGGLGHWWLGGVDWGMVTSLLVGSIPGIVIGSHIAARVPEFVLRPVLAAALVVAGSQLL